MSNARMIKNTDGCSGSCHGYSICGSPLLDRRCAGKQNRKKRPPGRESLPPRDAPKPADVNDARDAHSHGDALGMIRPQQLGDGRKPRLDLTNSVEFSASGTPFTDYHVRLSYNPPGMRIELTNPNNNPPHAIEVVAGKYAWNES